CVRILTGGIVPDGLDTVAMQEDCEGVPRDGQTLVRIPAGLKPGANRRRAGEDVQPGMALVQQGDRMRPQDLSAIASVGHAQVEVFRPVRVGVVSTGDEIVAPGEPLKPGEIYNSNKPLLTGLLSSLPVEVTDFGIWGDDQGLVTERLSQAAKQFDIVLTTGGASRGEEDHLITAVDTLGKRHLWQLAIKPGRPMGFGQIGDS
ncbi:MAG: molybdopterin molybdotransferase MoeA, partial [Pseudomonadota bacterium]